MSIVRTWRAALLGAALLGSATVAWAQTTPPADTPDPDEPVYAPPPVPEGEPQYLVPDDFQPEELEGGIPGAPGENPTTIDELMDQLEDGTTIDPGDEISILPDLPPAPDYSALPPKAERAARLEVLFTRLKDEEDTERARLISEEIWAIWMDSGSASVNYLLLRSDEAMKSRQSRKARRFLDQMTALEPEFAEAYARSARLALEAEDYGRALSDSTQALIHEPRHFYALYTLGSTLEKLGRDEQALAVYEEAHALFPKLGNVKQRVEKLRSSVLGDVL